MLKAGSTTRLFANIVFSMLSIALYGWVLSVSKFAGAFGLLCSIHGLVLAVRLIDLPGPVVSAGRNGLVFSNQITGEDLLAWDEIKSLKLFTLHYQFVSLPWMSYLVIRTSRRSYFSGTSRLLPTSWFGVYFLPTRLLHGGARSARQLLTILERLREADRHDLAAGAHNGLMDDAALRWGIMRNVTFPLPKDGLPDDAKIAGIEDAVMEAVGVHRDLMPEPVRQQVLTSDDGKALAAQARAWGEQAVREIGAEERAKEAPRPAFGRKGVLLNGKPLN